LAKIRLDKFVSNMTKLSRTEATAAVYHNNITVNGKIKKDPALKIDPDNDEICYKGEKIEYEEFVYYVLNKPAGVVSATEDKKYKTVCELIDTPREIAPVGRLDIDTEGLLLLTDDGKLAHKLISPKSHVDKVYYAEVDGSITDEVIKGFEEGIDYGEDKPSLPGNLEIITSTADSSSAYVTIHEGKFHQIKRMFEVYGLHVTYLKRIAMGELKLEDMKITDSESGDIRPIMIGEYVKITKDDILKL